MPEMFILPVPDCRRRGEVRLDAETIVLSSLNNEESVCAEILIGISPGISSADRKKNLSSLFVLNYSARENEGMNSWALPYHLSTAARVSAKLLRVKKSLTKVYSVSSG